MTKKIYDPTGNTSYKTIERLAEPYAIDDKELFTAKELTTDVDQYKDGVPKAKSPYRLDDSIGVAGMAEGVQKR